MAPLSFISVVLLLGFTTCAQGFKCHEGFNMSLGGIPLYHWKKRTCAANSKCFGQEIKVKLGLDVEMKYGGCISQTYGNYLDCNQLFGPESTLNPTLLLDIIPDVVGQFNATIYDFVTGGVEEIITLLSNGQGTATFIDGIFMFYDNLGFNMEKAEPLKPALTNLLAAVFKGNNAIIQQRATEILNALGNLDTANQAFTDAIYKFLGNFMDPTALQQQVKDSPFYKPIIERMPGLLRSIFPSTWEVPLWYDVTFELLSDVNVKNWKQTTIDIVVTIRKTYTIPDDVKEYVDPFFDRIPDLVEKLAAGNVNYAGNWSLELLKQYSEVNDATTTFSTALIRFVENVANTTLQYEFRTTIQWGPGLFYKFFPGDKTAIEEVYTKMAAGFNSFDFTDPSQTANPSALSTFIIDFVKKVMGAPDLPADAKAYIINFSRMFYDLMSSYSNYVDEFVKILSDGLGTWPNINTGKLIRDLIVGMNATVPAELEPLLTNLQPVITAAMSGSGPTGYNPTALYAALTDIINAYKTAFPGSPFPEVIQSYITNIKAITELDYTQPDAFQKSAELQLELQLLQIDLQFAFMNSSNYTNDEFVQMVIKAFPEYETYIKLMQTLKPEDIKQLMREIVTWASRGPGHDYSAQSFVNAIKPTIQKIVTSINNLLGDIRKIFEPESCKFVLCSEELCNTQTKIDSQIPVTKPPPTTPTQATNTTFSTKPATTTHAMTSATTTLSTTSGGKKISFNDLLNVATMWMAIKAFLG